MNKSHLNLLSFGPKIFFLALARNISKMAFQCAQEAITCMSRLLENVVTLMYFIVMVSLRST